MTPASALLPVIALTAGEPAGVGPDLCIALSHQDLPCRLSVIGDLDVLRARAGQLGIHVNFITGDTIPDHQQGALHVHHIPVASTVVPGTLNPDNSAHVLALLDAAIAGCMNGSYQAVVTAPVHKGVINDAGYAFTGHTEYLADHSGTARVVMMLAGGGLRVALATTHLPLRAVANAIRPKLLTDVIRILHTDLQKRFGIAFPRIIVAGLNPHAGESGHLGREEIDIIEPVLARLRTEGIDLIGPLPADTLFSRIRHTPCDAVLAMYHDQGLPVLKYASFGEGVNVTLGLPFIRTSVDHGTALDLAGTGRAEVGSLVAAIEMALGMVNSEREAVNG
ncbi:MAG TPA: 4-hydroxythreonine-4-phosphate dehydrogenase PdxA [Thiobacillus sp.]|nr:MAG: 4-hydroxythreonine-4-phosphate dehydrogenase PdxA [Hydrogenophilales bacterium 28-61-11]OYZ58347.1 MAG: 4-hydroxythreonine-4-phosphate dehydrogenase PdxA [Hydrogenophilales bacterium 16-61-112]HQT30567.1 4-hydroxythreonine-4-phosphate dehydrogenase PdxA [Thiobacillus sp.]HQT69941.1 4-hydroxythreonine-4-phosphate dehydrogenase PdxA [Thiobacillus sp.]